MSVSNCEIVKYNASCNYSVQTCDFSNVLYDVCEMISHFKICENEET
jgi:hypothetical protein